MDGDVFLTDDEVHLLRDFRKECDAESEADREAMKREGLAAAAA